MKARVYTVHVLPTVRAQASELIHRRRWFCKPLIGQTPALYSELCLRLSISEDHCTHCTVTMFREWASDIKRSQSSCEAWDC
jgi:hypothetical protein